MQVFASCDEKLLNIFFIDPHFGNHQNKLSNYFKFKSDVLTLAVSCFCDLTITTLSEKNIDVFTVAHRWQSFMQV